MADTNVLQDKWAVIRSKIRPRWMALTDEDVANIDGNLDALIALLREKYGYTEMQAEGRVHRFLEENGAVPASERV